MATVAIRKATVQGLTANQRKIVRYVLSALDLNDPAAYVDGASVHWFVFDDPRITLTDIAVFGTLARLLGNAIVAGYDPTDDDPSAVRAKIRQALQSQVVAPSAVSIPTDADPFATVLAAQNAPAAVLAVRSIPQDWVPE